MMDGLEATVVKMPRVHRDAFCPRSLCKQLPQRGRKLSHHFWNCSPLGRQQQRLPSAVTCWGTQRMHLPSETAGRAEHWNVINCLNWNLARTPRLTTYTYRGEKKSFNELRKKRSKNCIKTDNTTYPAVAYFSREWLDGRREGKRLGLLEF